MQVWHLHTSSQSLVFASISDAMPEVIYWGSSLGADVDLSSFMALHEADVAGGMLDQNPPLSICPEAARTFSGHPGLMARDQYGHVLRPCFKVISSQQSDTHVTCVLEDKDLKMTYEMAAWVCDQSDVIGLKAEIKSETPVTVGHFAAPVLPAPHYATKMIDVSGKWAGEFQLNHISWAPGCRLRENRTGRSGHEHFPAILLPEKNTTYASGNSFGISFGWSGGHRMIAEELSDGRRQVQFSTALDSEATAITHLETPPIYLAYSTTGLNGIATSWQAFIRNNLLKLPQKSLPRPVHYNCWEAVYFDHDLENLKKLVEVAASIGAERFVLDDGWFGKRHDDTTSLGDWHIDLEKYPQGLTPLIEKVHQTGMDFGLWVEPEMISEQSDLFQRHPEWVLGPKTQAIGRQQMLLDMSLEDVRSYLYDILSGLLSKYAISYLKWDHNRVLPISDTRQTKGLYKLIDRLRHDFPEVEIESCASGGARLDYGILERTQRVWLSDSNDALQRAKIQHVSALFLPAIVVGSHVGPDPCHTSGRSHRLSFRAWIAASRHLGFEMDLLQLSEVERETLTRITAWWKSQRAWMLQADLLLLDNGDPAVLAEQHLSQDKQKFVAFITQSVESTQVLPRPICFLNLEPRARYRISLVNRDEVSAASRGKQPLKTQDLILSGEALMRKGLSLPCSFPESIWVIEGQIVSDPSLKQL